MAVNKVVMNTPNGEETIIDLTGDTVTPATLAEGATAHAANGEVIRGAMPASGENTIPNYWISELETKAEDIRIAMETAGRNKSAFLWYTDAHWPLSSKKSPALLKYLMANTPMNKVNFGGDIIGDPSAFTHENIKYAYEWRKMVSDISNHHSVFGNHDVNHNGGAEIRNMAYSFMIAPEESSDMVMGDGAYYYIDNNAEKTRYLYLEYMTSDHNAMMAQGAFIVDAIKSTPEEWHIVAINHRWWQYSSASAPTTGLVPNYEKEILSVFDAYNARTTTSDSNYFYAQDFTDCKGKVAFCIGGHIHIDHDFESDGGIPVIITAPDTNQERSSGDDEDSGTIGTITESAVFGIIADYTDAENTKITVVGVGRGTSRVIGGAVEPELINIFNKNDPDVLIGGRINSSGNAVYYADGQLVTGWIEAEAGDTITIQSDKANNANAYTGSVTCYKSDKTLIRQMNWEWITSTATSSDDYKTVTIKILDSANGTDFSKTAWVRVGVAYTDIDSIVITKQ